ncbi:MAG: hypothetical protein BalsKO_02360 [Balneolaceae bacterium]
MKKIKGSALEDGCHHHEHHDLHSRKDFLKKLGLFTAGSSFILGNRPVQALQSSSLFKKLAGLETNRVLVLIQLEGGNDGLNTIVPVENDIYYNARAELSISKSEAVSLTDTIGMHPVMSPLETLWNDGKMGVIQNVGYPSGDLSHFRSTDIWLTGSAHDEYLQTGWMGRNLDLRYPDFQENPAPSPLAVQIGGASSLLFKGDSLDMGMTLNNVDILEYLLENGEIYSKEGLPNSLAGDEMEFMRTQANNSFRYADTIKNSYDSSSNKVEFSTESLGRSLSIVSRLIKGNLDTKIFLVSLNGFDTHANQLEDHASLLSILSNAVANFYADLAADNRSEEVLIATFSEFGRRVQKNGAAGTDHGTAAPLLVFGDQVEGGMIGSDPKLGASDLDEFGNLVHEYDFRQVYSTLLNDWFELDEDQTEATMGGSFERIPFLKTGTGVSNESGSSPYAFQLQQNYPNPFNPETTISFTLQNAQDVKLEVYDIQGRIVQTLVEGKRSAGSHTIRFNASNLSSGTYLYRLFAGSKVITKTMTLIK